MQTNHLSLGSDPNEEMRLANKLFPLPKLRAQRVNALRRIVVWSFCIFGLIHFSGCGTTTQRTATEQMLMSDAVDLSVSRIDFRPLSGKKAFVDTAYIRPSQFFGQLPSQLQGFVNADYVVSSLRQHMFAAHVELVDDKNQAEIVIEPRIGTLATNGHDMVYGLPQTNALSQAASTLAGTSLIPPIPELSFGRTNSQFGLAKIAVFAYDRETKEPIWQSGTAKSESTAKNAWFMGAGPFRSGSIYQGRRFAGTTLSKQQLGQQFAEHPIPFDKEHVFQQTTVPVVNPDPATPPTAPPAASTASQGNPAH